MNVLSLFDGISCGRVALERAGIKVDKYYASEIDKYAMQVAQKNYPDTIQVGDITKLKGSDFQDIDLIIGGSPCQGFSFAGKQLNFDDARSKLFFEYVRLLKEIKPKYFLLENVKMKKEYQNIISGHVGVEPIQINSALVSAHNRERLYWNNMPNITQPTDKGILLKDILEEGVTDREKSYCIDANYWKGGNLKSYFGKGRRQLVFDSPNQIGFIKQNHRGSRIYSKNGKSVTLCSSGGGWGMKTGLYKDGKNFRMLTPIECERLQTLPDNYTEGISNTQRYKCLGNGWTVDVIAWILSHIQSKELYKAS